MEVVLFYLPTALIENEAFHMQVNATIQQQGLRYNLTFEEFTQVPQSVSLISTSKMNRL
jgi:hypothetical protein